MEAGIDAATQETSAEPTITAVICEDHTLLRDAIGHALTSNGITVRAATGTLRDTRSALQVFEPDVLVLDLQLPDGSGIDLMQEVHTRPGDAPKVLVLSGVVEPLEVQRAVDAGARGFLSKFADRDEIASAVETVAGGGDAFDGHAASAVVRAVRSGAPSSQVELTAREVVILKGMADGQSNVTIAKRAGVSPQTIKTQATSIYRKLNVADRAGAVAAAFRLQLIE